MAQGKQGKARKKEGVFKETFYVKAYILAKQGMNDGSIAHALGVSLQIFRYWKKRKKAFREALELARQEVNSGVDTFRDFVFNSLPEHLQRVWEELNECEENGYGPARIKALLEGHGRRARQHLFVYALCHTNFNLNEALRKLCISSWTYDTWLKNDPEFCELMDQLHWHKKNFFESALMGLIARGDPSAIIFANKTINRDRGYSEKVKVEVSGQVNHLHAVIPVDELNLPLEVRKQILEAVREAKPKVIEGQTNGEGRILGIQ